MIKYKLPINELNQNYWQTEFEALLLITCWLRWPAIERLQITRLAQVPPQEGGEKAGQEAGQAGGEAGAVRTEAGGSSCRTAGPARWYEGIPGKQLKFILSVF